MALGDRIAAMRKAAGYTQDSLSEKLGKSQRTVAAWECGDRMPTFDMLGTLADFFDVSIDYLLDRTDIPNIYKNTNNPAPAAPDPEPSTDMPKDIAELKQLITSIVNQVLASNQQPNEDRAAPEGPPVRRSVGKE